MKKKSTSLALTKAQTLEVRKAVGQQLRNMGSKGVTFTPWFAGGDFLGRKLPGSDVDFAREVNNGMESSVVTSALCWMMRTFPEAPVIIQRLAPNSDEEKWERQPRHPLADLLRRPNPEYGGIVLWQATVLDFCFGEAFWLKVKNGMDELVELWWIPRLTITPVPDPITGLLSHYNYNPGFGGMRTLRPDEVVHFRFGFHPDRRPLYRLRGFSPLAAVMREVFTDEQAANFTAAILKNMGIIGVLITPEPGGGGWNKEATEKLKDEVQTKFTGDRRGSAMVASVALKAQLLQYQLQGFDLGPIRDIAEERVTAALGIPAAVIGFGTGLQQTKVGATMREMIKLAWQGGIEPQQRALADEMDRSLLPEFHTNVDLFRTHFDTSQVEALTESPTEKTNRVLKLVQGNLQKISDAQRELGLPVDASMDKYDYQIEPKKTVSTPPFDVQPPARVATVQGSEDQGTPSGETNVGQ
jgi:phage portal protein BeeE